MCGICGIIDNKKDKIDQGMLRGMCFAMEHRGPDGEGIYISPYSKPAVGLGHRRLKIIDLSDAGNQPITNEDKSIWLVLNGEIYNYHQLRKDLESRGHQFRSHTDAEVVLHLYEDFAEGCLSYLRGMFAFAIWDGRDNKLFLARDRIGKKPLLYYYDNQYFCFASEFSALLACGLFNREINYEAIDKYLTFGYVPAPETIYRKVFKMLPAHYAIFKDGRLSLQKYWELDYSRKTDIPEKEAAQELTKILKEAVGLRLVSDVPLGVFLSGGIDSSVVTALMSESIHKVKTFSIGFDNADFDELKYARNIAKYFSTDHQEFIVKPKAIEILPLLVERYGEPYADSSAIPSYYVSRETKRYVTVALNGDGGDESFAGYERYQAMAFAEGYNRLPVFFRNGLNQAVIRLLPDSVNFKNKRRRLRRLFENVSLPFYSRYCRWVCMIDRDVKNNLYREDFKKRLDNNDPADWLRDYPALPDKMDLVDSLMAIDIKTNLPNDLVVKMDIASMANSLETRSPFLDHKLMEFAASLPAKYKMNGFIKKYLLKKVAQGLIPGENIHRKKMGFGVPVGAWFRDELKDFLCDNLLSTTALGRGYFKPEAIENMVKKHTGREIDYTSQLWSLLMLELWHQRFID